MKHNLVNMHVIALAVGYGHAEHRITTDASSIEVFSRMHAGDANKPFPAFNGGLPLIFPNRKAGDVLSFAIPAGTFQKAHTVMTTGAQSGVAPPHMRALVATAYDEAALDASREITPGELGAAWHTHGSLARTGVEIGAQPYNVYVLVLTDGEVALGLSYNPEK